MIKSNKTIDRPLLGAHVSISGGVEKAPERGKNLGCDCIQIFSKNQNQWKSKPLTEENIEGFKRGLIEFGIQSVLIHDSYLINLCSPDEAKWKMSFDAFIEEIDRGDLLDVEQLVFHPGSHMGEGEEAGLKKIAESLNRIIDLRPDSKVKLLLETTAGQGTNLGYRFEHLRQIINLVEDKERMAVCLDTQHAFASGYDIRDEESYNSMWKLFEEVIGLKRLQAIHLNDSKKEYASRRDRHEHIGEGLIGENAFRFLLNDPHFYGIGMYLETPDGDEEYIKNLKLLRSFIK